MTSQVRGLTVHIEDIQDHVELALMRSGHHKVARAYVIYREQQSQKRAAEAAEQGADEQAMSRSLRALFVSLPLALPLLATGGLAHAQQAFGYDEAERQQELLEVWYEIRESNAQKGNTAAMFDVGMANYAGRGTAVDYDQALRWFARAADADHASAHYYLGYSSRPARAPRPTPNAVTNITHARRNWVMPMPSTGWAAIWPMASRIRPPHSSGWARRQIRDCLPRSIMWG